MIGAAFRADRGISLLSPRAIESIFRRASTYAKRIVLLLSVAISFPVTAAFPQSATAHARPVPSPTFDVASVRPLTYADGARTHIDNPPQNSEFKAVNVTLRALLEVAYELPETQMLGGPGWTTADKFDLEAKSDPSLNHQLASLSPNEGKQVKRQMLRALLADRFKLAAHTETREMPMYALVVAKGGSKLVKLSTSGTALSDDRGRISIKEGDDCLAVLAFELSWRLGFPVIDRTGLEGSYELNLNWNEDEGASTPSDASAGPSLFTAIQEQLGLKLESTKGAVPVLIIDHAERPSEN